MGPSLTVAVKKWPTPQASMMTNADMEQAKFAGNNPDRPKYKDAGKGSLNPDWVEWLMGWPIGWSSLEPIDELLWLGWSVDPADMEKPETYCTPTCDDASGNISNAKPNQIPMLRRSADKLLRNKNIGPISRVATNIKDRVNRLKAIGNGQVSLCVKLAWKVLTRSLI
jgi:hypothetical protein